MPIICIFVKNIPFRHHDKRNPEWRRCKIFIVIKIYPCRYFSAITVILYYFWAVPYRAALNYREQLQLFQTTRTYFEDLIGRPGGLSAYIGEFLTQFFNNFWIGAAVMTGLLLLVMLLCYLTSNRFAPSSPKSTNLVLSLTPLISLLMFLGNPDVTLTFVAALSISLAGAYLFTSIITDHKKL